MTIFQAFVLGLLQGLGEFLPISSSAHLALAPWLFHWEDPGLAFDVVLHLGTLIAVLWYFRWEWIALIQAAFRIVRQRSIRTAEERRVLFLIIATIPGAVAGLALDKYAESAFRDPRLIAVALVVMGLVLWGVDTYARRTRAIENMGYGDALAIGLAQMFAIIPGVSRSGSTITAGRALGLNRQSAAVFSFLMSTPIIAAAAVLKVPQVLRTGGLSLTLLVGVLASAISGWVAIAVLLRFVSNRSYGVFAVYRIVVGLLVLGIAFLR
jgi:undecaprenyl-diphosphatase